MRKLTELEGNIFTVKIKEVIIPEGVIIKDDNGEETYDTTKLDHIFLVMTLVDQDFK